MSDHGYKNWSWTDQTCNVAQSCQQCGHTIPAGEPHKLFVGEHGEMFVSCPYHTDCIEAAQTAMEMLGMSTLPWLAELDAEEVVERLSTEYPEVAHRMGWTTTPEAA